MDLKLNDSSTKKDCFDLQKMSESQQNEQGILHVKRNSSVTKTYRSDDILKIFDVNYLSSIAVKKVTIGQAANGVTPTIASVSTKLNSEICCTVIKTWILSINAYVGKECFSAYQAHELSAIISAEAYYLTLAELAIFFNWVKAGKFGQIYGQLDPVFITSALQQFLITRRDAIDKYNRDTQREKIERSHDNGDTIKAAISLSSYEEYKKQFNKENNED